MLPRKSVGQGCGSVGFVVKGKMGIWGYGFEIGQGSGIGHIIVT